MSRLQQWVTILGALAVALVIATLASAHGGDITKVHSCVVVVPSGGSPGGTQPVTAGAVQSAIRKFGLLGGERG